VEDVFVRRRTRLLLLVLELFFEADPLSSMLLKKISGQSSKIFVQEPPEQSLTSPWEVSKTVTSRSSPLDLELLLELPLSLLSLPLI